MLCPLAPKGLTSFQLYAGLPDFSWYMIPRPEKNVPNEHKMYQMVIQYTKCQPNIPNGYKIYQHFPI
jgi:hypothetical protein